MHMLHMRSMTYACTCTCAQVPLYVRGGCVYVQSVLLFSVGDERRIRVVTRPLQVVEHLPRLAQSIHLPTCLALQTKQANPPGDL